MQSIGLLYQAKIGLPGDAPERRDGRCASSQRVPKDGSNARTTAREALKLLAERLS
jgi:hypothetical protein